MEKIIKTTVPKYTSCTHEYFIRRTHYRILRISNSWSLTKGHVVIEPRDAVQSTHTTPCWHRTAHCFRSQLPRLHCCRWNAAARPKRTRWTKCWGKKTQKNEILQSYVSHQRLFSEYFNMHLWLLKENQNIHLRSKWRFIKNKSCAKKLLVCPNGC